MVQTRCSEDRRDVLSLGTTLREARRRADRDLAECEVATKVRGRYLIALEEERFESLPEPAYVRGMIRAYARHLGLDPEPLVEEYDDRTGGRRDDVPAPPVSTSSRRSRAGTRPVMRRRRRDTRWAWLSAGAVLGAAVLVWIGASREPAPVTPLAPLPEGSARTTRTVTAPPAATTAPVAPPPAAPAARAGVLRLVGVDGGSWVQVRRGGADGDVLYEGTLAAGASRRFPVGERLWVRLGWGSGVRATVGGRAASLPEGTGDVVVTRRGVAVAPA